MTKRPFLKSLAAAAIALACVGAHAQDSLARVKQTGVLKVGTETAFAPYDFIKDGSHALQLRGAQFAILDSCWICAMGGPCAPAPFAV